MKQMVRSKVNTLRKTVEPKRHGILELNSMKEFLKEIQENMSGFIRILEMSWNFV